MALPRTTKQRPKPTPKRPLPTSKVKAKAKPPLPILKAKKAKKPKYQAKLARMWHPDQSVYIDISQPAELEMDSWLTCQIKAGLITEVS